MSYAADRAFGERFLPQVCRIVGPLLLRPSPFELDARQATDLIVLRAENVEIGVRIRRAGYGARWPHDFTLRCARDSGAKTELGKILEGSMRWFFYGHAADERWLESWMLLDMNVFRKECSASGYRDLERRRLFVRRSNDDGTHFVACDVRLWPGDLVILRSADQADAA